MNRRCKDGVSQSDVPLWHNWNAQQVEGNTAYVGLSTDEVSNYFLSRLSPSLALSRSVENVVAKFLLCCFYLLNLSLLSVAHTSNVRLWKAELVFHNKNEVFPVYLIKSLDIRIHKNFILLAVFNNQMHYRPLRQGMSSQSPCKRVPISYVMNSVFM